MNWNRYTRPAADQNVLTVVWPKHAASWPCGSGGWPVGKKKYEKPSGVKLTEKKHIPPEGCKRCGCATGSSSGGK